LANRVLGKKTRGPNFLGDQRFEKKFFSTFWGHTMNNCVFGEGCGFHHLSGILATSSSFRGGPSLSLSSFYVGKRFLEQKKLEGIGLHKRKGGTKGEGRNTPEKTSPRGRGKHPYQRGFLPEKGGRTN